MAITYICFDFYTIRRRFPVLSRQYGSSNRVPYLSSNNSIISLLRMFVCVCLEGIGFPSTPSPDVNNEHKPFYILYIILSTYMIFKPIQIRYLIVDIVFHLCLSFSLEIVVVTLTVQVDQGFISISSCLIHLQSPLQNIFSLASLLYLPAFPLIIRKQSGWSKHPSLSHYYSISDFSPFTYSLSTVPEILHY